MASGDRIEILSNGTFEDGVKPLAKESSLTNVSNAIATNSSKIDTVNSNITTVTNSVNSDIWYSSQAYNYAVDIDNSKIGATNSTGGSATAGNIMAKLNAIITLLNNNSNNLIDYMYIPSNNVLKNVLNKSLVFKQYYYNGQYFYCKYNGAIKINITSHPAETNGSSFYYGLSAVRNVRGLYPGCNNVSVGSNPSGDGSASTGLIETAASTTTSLILNVKAGDVVYIYLTNQSCCSNITCTSITVTGTVTKM